MILLLDFGTVSKILICFNLIKRFPNGHTRYSRHLQVWIMQRVAPIKVYLTIYESLNPIQDGGAPITSKNVGISPPNHLPFIFDPFATLA